MPPKKRTKIKEPVEEVATRSDSITTRSDPVTTRDAESRCDDAFVLLNIDPEDIERRYAQSSSGKLNPIIPPPIARKFAVQSQPFAQRGLTTPLFGTGTSHAVTSLMRDKHYFSFLDETRRYCITMIDAITESSVPSGNCFWCRHSFPHIPIGCPLKYVSNTVSKQCQSEITKEVYTIEQSVPISATDKREDYYETDGVFCSFNCCFSWIQSQPHNPQYRQSKFLLTKMYRDIFPAEDTSIRAAPDWRLLKTYGGHLDIDDFRTACEKYVYIDRHHVVTRIPKVQPTGHIFEEIMTY